MTDNVLDGDIWERREIELQEGEEIHWRGTPKRYFSLTILEAVGYYNSISIVTGLQLITLLATYFRSKNHLSEGSIIEFLITIIIGGIIIVLPDLFKHKRKLETQYFITNKRMVIASWRLGRKKIFSMRLDEVNSIGYIAYKNGTGEIYFTPKNKINFKVKDLVVSEKRANPAFELIENVVAECQKIKKIQETNRRIGGATI